MDNIKDLIARANSGDSEAQLALDKATGSPEGTYAQAVNSVVHAKKAAENGDINAVKALGSAYFLGVGTEKDINLAVNWYKKAAEKSDPEALFRLGQIYFSEYDEYEKAKSLINEAVKRKPIEGVTQAEIDYMLESIESVMKAKM